MSRQEEIEHTATRIKERVGERARHYAHDAVESAQELIERGRQATRNLGAHRGDYARQLTHYLEDAADELGYRYRRVKRHAKRRPVATALVVAGTVGAFLLLRHVFRHEDDEG